MQQNEQIAKEASGKLEALTTAVQTLVETSIKSEERHKQYDSRFERAEITAKEQEQKLDHVSDVLIKVEKDLERGADWRKTMNKIASGTAISIISAIILASLLVAKP